MPKKSNKRSNKRKTRKQNTIMMIGCSKKNKKSCKNVKVGASLRSNKECPNCGPNCHCGPNCNCPHPCPGNCYLNRRMKKQKGGYGYGCGSCGCPIAPLSYKQMNQFGGNYNSYPNILNQPVLTNIKGDYDSILGTVQNGGTTCNTCGQSGGNFFGKIGPMPGPFTGSAWTPNNLPGEDGISSNRNYLPQYDTNQDPQRQMLPSDADAGYMSPKSMVGGYVYNKKDNPKSSSIKSNSISISKKGGGLVPQDLVNLGRDFGYNFKSAYNALNGYKAPVDPTPYKDQLTGSINKNIFVA